MKRHGKFTIIRWLGDERTRPERYGVVEIDKQGPILRSGPLPRTTAQQHAHCLERGLPTPSPSIRVPGRSDRG